MINLPRIAVLASGSGSNFQAIVEACQRGELNAEVVVLLTNNPKALVVDRARTLGIPVVVINHRKVEFESWDRAMVEALSPFAPEWVVMAGFLRKLGLATLNKFEGRIVNTHPSLLPKYGGQGMYGRRVHEAVINAGERETGISVHIVTADYDSGPVLAQTRVAILPDDSAESLEARLKHLERLFYIKTLDALVSGKLHAPLL